MEKRTFKDKIYDELATIVKALSNPNRLEIVELLAQGYFSVEEVANQTDLSVANASQHLQVLKRVQLVDTRREGNYVFYSLADQSIYKAWKALRDVGMERVAEIEKTMRMFRESKSSMKTMSSSELAQRMEDGDVTIIDVRPEREFNEGHIAGALNVPVEDLAGRLAELPEKKEVVAYCRGPFCVLADEAVELLHEKGYSAWRLNEGFPEWMLEHLPVSKNG